ncbi:hypothetical protein HPB49_026677 [Dermacentor silvarum]|nr:hypothetical protein HPB49_026677 [Dermacentor silvarum]
MQTTEGRVRGTILRSLGKIVDEYRGIPFAEPPVGIFRFRPPQPKAPWEGTLDATAGTTACPQLATVPSHPNPIRSVRLNDRPNASRTY